MADYLGCSIDYIVGRTDNPRPIDITPELSKKLQGMTGNFITEDSIIHPPFMSNRVYFVQEKDYDKLIIIFDKAKKFKSSIMSKKKHLALFTYYETTLSRVAGANGYSIAPKNYVEFKKIYNVYVDACFNGVLKKV